MKYLVLLILKSNCIFLIIVALIFVFEKVTGWIGAFRVFAEKKESEIELHTASLVFSLLYFLFMVFMLGTHYWKDNSFPNNFPFLEWLYIVSGLSVLFLLTYFKYHEKKMKK